MADTVSIKYEDPRFGNLLKSLGISALTDYLSDYTGSMFGDDSELGRGLGTLFSSGVSSVGNTLSNNILKGTTLTEGLGVNAGASIAGAGAGLAANYIGRGINSLGGNSMLSRGIGLGVATGLGTIGGLALGNLVKTGTASNSLTSSINAIKTFNAARKIGKATDAMKAAKMAGVANLAGLGMTVAGTALGAALGPSKEYGGKRGNITKTMDTAYDAIMAGANFIPGYGLILSGAMALNKGLSNIFGSTSGMTTQDAILGSAFMPAPVKWLNMAGANTTSTFNNQSWQNTEKANSFMGNAFGNLLDRFDLAREEAGKTYGLASSGAYKKALNNLNFANTAWGQILAMADLNELQNIRSLYMTSINNLRYAQMIQGGWNPIARGKQGMKIFNNATNHKVGMRLLSGAALIDNKQMILSALGGTKMRGRMPAHPRKGSDKDSAATKAYEEWQRELDIRREETKKQQAEEQARKLKLREEAASKFNLQANLVQTAMNLQANETPFTGQEYQQAAENLRLEKIEKFHEKAEELGKGFEAALMADLAVSAAPLLLKGFRWGFNKAGLLVKVPLEKTNLFLTSPYTGKWTQFGNREYRFKPGYAAANGVPVESRPVISEVNWDPDYWFKTISGRNSYSAEEASELASNVPEYKEIEKHLFDEGKLIVDTSGNITVKGSKMSPLEYIMRQSKAFQKMNPEHHYTGVPKLNMEYFEKNPVDVESWSDRISPKNVEEYAFGNFKTRKEILDNIKYFEDLENKNGITESTQDWLKIYRLLLEDFDANIKLMKAKNHGRVYDITYPNDLNTFNMDALGNHWARIPSEIPAKAGVPRRYLRPGEVATDDIVSASNEIEPSIVNIDNVMDTYDGTLLNETIIPRFVPKKSVLGNTGNFDLSNPSLFRSLMPLTVGGSTVATLYNKSK